MKKQFLATLGALVVGLSIGTIAGEDKGTLYNGQAKGLIGNIKIAADFDGSKVASVRVLEHSETPALGGEALKKLAISSIGKELSEVDSIAGATYTSNGFKEALETAFNTKKISN